MTKKITILWGTDKEEKQTYTFENQHDLNTFLHGVNEANGWLDYEVVEVEWQKTRHYYALEFMTAIGNIPTTPL